METYMPISETPNPVETHMHPISENPESYGNPCAPFRKP
jgi:hypothetical protein